MVSVSEKRPSGSGGRTLAVFISTVSWLACQISPFQLWTILSSFYIRRFGAGATVESASDDYTTMASEHPAGLEIVSDKPDADDKLYPTSEECQETNCTNERVATTRPVEEGHQWMHSSLRKPPQVTDNQYCNDIEVSDWEDCCTFKFKPVQEGDDGWGFSEMVPTGPSLKPTPFCYYISTKSCHDDMPPPSVSETGSNGDVECAQEVVDSRENGNTSNQPAVGKYPASEVLLSEEQSPLHPSTDSLANEGGPDSPSSGPLDYDKGGSSKCLDPGEMVSGTGSKDVKSNLALLDQPFDSGWDTKLTTTLPP